MASHQGRLYHCGAVASKRSTFADANRNRDFRVFSGLFESMLAQARRGFRRRIADAVRLIELDRAQARGGRGGVGALLDLGLRRQGACDLRSGPRPAGLSRGDRRQPQRHHRSQGDADRGGRSPHVFDLGYYDFAFWAKLDAFGCRLVTRFKTNTPLNAPRDLPLEPGSTLLSDRIGFLPARQAMNRKNPMQDAVREIVVKTETGETLRLLTNDLDASAQEIADLYKRRWQIELFFRLMKQTLKITKFVGRSENAVRIQIAVALIAFLLLRQLQDVIKAKHGFLELARTRARQSHA